VDQISFRSRSAGGVKVFNTSAGEFVVSVARVAEAEAEAGAEDEAPVDVSTDASKPQG
jgi:DNA gyrase subunit A